MPYATSTLEKSYSFHTSMISTVARDRLNDIADDRAAIPKRSRSISGTKMDQELN